MVLPKWQVESSKWILIDNQPSSELTASLMTLLTYSQWWLIALSNQRTLSLQVSVSIRTKRATNSTPISEEIKPSTIQSTQLLSDKTVLETNYTETEPMSQTWLPTLSKTSKTLSSLLTELSSLPPESKITRNLLIWSTKKCSSPNYQPRAPKDLNQLTWEVKLEILLNQAAFMLLSLSKEPTTKTVFLCWSPKKFSETTEDQEESREIFSLRMPSSMEPMHSAPATKKLVSLVWKFLDQLHM